MTNEWYFSWYTDQKCLVVLYKKVLRLLMKIVEK